MSAGDEQRGGRPARVLAAAEEVDDQVPDHHAARASDELGREVLAEDRDEDEDDSGRDPRPHLRQQDAEDRGPRRRAEVHRGLELVPVEPLERRVERQRREREVEVDEHEDHRRPVVEEERHRLVGDVRPLQEAVDRSALAEDVEPRVDAEQVARPEREDDEHEQEALELPRHVADEPVGERERDQDRDRGRGDGDPDRRPERPEIGRDAEEVAVVVERPVVDDVVVDRLPEAVGDDQRERSDEEESVENERREEARRTGRGRPSRRPAARSCAAPRPSAGGSAGASRAPSGSII